MQPDDDIFAQFDLAPFGVDPKPSPEDKSNARRKLAPAKAGGKRGRPKKPPADSKPIQSLVAEARQTAAPAKERAPRKQRAPKIEVAETVTKMLLNLSHKQRQTVIATLTRLFA
jgi:hypothetical protein